MKLLQTWMTVLCLVCAVFLTQGGTAVAALYQGDIGETRFTTPEGTYVLKRYVPPQKSGSASGSSFVPIGTYEVVSADGMGRLHRLYPGRRRTEDAAVYHGGAADCPR